MLFEQYPLESELNQHHDLGKPPIGKMFNKQFVKLPDGEFAIKFDIEIYDKETFTGMGGFSFSAMTERYSLYPSREPSVEILFNTEVFEKEDILPLLEFSNETFNIEARELKQKALENIPILILKFAAGYALNKTADKAFNLIEPKILELGRKIEGKIKDVFKYQVLFKEKFGDNEILIVLDLKIRDLDLINERNIPLTTAVEFIKNNINNSKIKRVALRFLDKEPYWDIIYLLDLNNSTIKF